MGLFDIKGYVGLFAIWGKGRVASTLRRIIEALFWPYVWWGLTVWVWCSYGWVFGALVLAFYVAGIPILHNAYNSARYGAQADAIISLSHGAAEEDKPLPVDLS